MMWMSRQCYMKYRQCHFILLNLSHVSKYYLAHSTIMAKLNPNYDPGFSCSAQWDQDIRLFQNRKCLTKSFGFSGDEVYEIDSKAWPHKSCWITIFYHKEIKNKHTFLKYLHHEVNWNISTHQWHHRDTPATRPFGPDSVEQRVLDHCHLSWQTERGACSAVNRAAPPFLLPAFCTNDGVLSVLQLSPIHCDTLDTCI